MSPALLTTASAGPEVPTPQKAWVSDCPLAQWSVCSLSSWEQSPPHSPDELSWKPLRSLVYWVPVHCCLVVLGISLRDTPPQSYTASPASPPSWALRRSH